MKNNLLNILSDFAFAVVVLVAFTIHNVMSLTFSDYFGQLTTPGSQLFARFWVLIIFLIISSYIGETMEAKFLNYIRSIVFIAGIYFIVMTILNLFLPLGYDSFILLAISFQLLAAMYIGRKADLEYEEE